jgi:NhaP-type Na+/H+ or K+/H+ antiporter
MDPPDPELSLFLYYLRLATEGGKRPMDLLVLSGTRLIIFLVGAILLVGFGADWLATRLRLPDVLWLIALGIIAGPVLGLIPPAYPLVLAPALGVAALVLILFDAGIDLRWSIVRPLAGSAVLFAVVSYALSTVVILVVGYLVLFPGDFVLSLLFGTALGCTSGAVVIHLANRLRLPTGLRSVVQLEAAVEDAFAIVTVTTLLAFLSPTSGSLALKVSTSVILPLPVGIAVGLVAGLVWLVFLYAWQDRQFAALATLGFLLVVYAFAQLLGGSGILAALVFGGVLGNEEIVRKFLRRSRPFHVSAELRRVEVEISFVLRSFFLFLIGMLVTLSNPGLAVGFALVVLILVLLGVRRLAFAGVTNPRHVPQAWANPVSALYGRGLTSAVLLVTALATVPASTRLLFPALLVIVGTNAAMTAVLYLQPTEFPRVEPDAERRWAETAAELISVTDALFLQLGSDPGARSATPQERAPPAEPPTGPPPLPEPAAPKR